MKNYIQYIGILALGMVACEPEFENPVDESGAYISGEADFSTFVSVGNSITSGYADNALYITSQQNSYPNIMAQQFAKAGGGDFTQPLMADNYGGLLLNGNQIEGFDTRLVLAFDAEGNAMPTNLNETPTTEVSDVLSGPFNNMGVPGMKSFHLGLNGYGNIAGLETGTANPYFVRFASSPDASILEDAIAQNPTFFSLWIGKNDILSFATSGGLGVSQTGNMDPRTYSSNDITDPGLFELTYSQTVEALIAAGAEQGVVNAVPDVTVAPFFTRVPYAPLSPADPSFGPRIPELNATFSKLNEAFTYLGVPERSIVFSETAASAVVVRDEALVDISAQLTEVLVGGGMDRPTATLYGNQFGQARQATANDKILLTSASAIGQVNVARVQTLMAMGLPQEAAGRLAVNGVTYPMEDQLVLTENEVEILNMARTQFNAAIQGIAQEKGLAYVDVNEIIQQLANGGIPFDGGVVNADFVTGGAFSLDGVHLTPRGSAILANKMIDAINATYGSTVPKVNVGSYGTITLSNNVQ